ncbi:unnamed protein product [Albugo candida]|uniref:Uncharacterized protein n=1 Tax=Albugo candida TaxID=65357 RepID=A0A024G702_9STRA|nr:unnamed protein product [Albugo candida]|eukprot:CCI42329.1 unnamed protein product [Albugo candida]
MPHGRKWRLRHEVSGIQCTLLDHGWVITRTNGEKDSLAQRCCLEATRVLRHERMRMRT